MENPPLLATSTIFPGLMGVVYQKVPVTQNFLRMKT
jgi:hypothetical protein